MTVITKFTCACCGHRTLKENPKESYEICQVCFWEQDQIQFDDPNYENGANQTSLRQAQKNFISFGACDEGMKKNVRQPSADEPKDPEWEPYQ